MHRDRINAENREIENVTHSLEHEVGPRPREGVSSSVVGSHGEGEGMREGHFLSERMAAAGNGGGGRRDAAAASDLVARMLRCIIHHHHRMMSF